MWAPPQQPAPIPPYAKGLYLYLAFSGLMGTAVGLFLCVLVTLEVFRVRELEARGIHTHGTVTDFYNTKGGREAEVSFQPPHGPPVGFRSNFDSDFKKGDEVPVVYLPERPKGASIDSWKELWGSTLMMGGFGTVMTVGGLVVFYVLRKRAANLP
jgi:Protein of unknown function (DUF3592)